MSCEWCGQPVERKRGPGRPPKYCNRPCRQRAYEARILGIPQDTTRQEIWEDCNGTCYLCNKPVTIEDMEIDHVIPGSFGGPTTRWNLKPTHGKCNREKAAQVLWLPADPAYAQFRYSAETPLVSDTGQIGAF